jgi:predicted flap endonuclease-1-like 5' DNA nuclease
MLNITHTSNFIFAFLAEGDDGGIPWWVWLIIIILAVLLIWYLWRWFTRPKSTRGQSAVPPIKADAPAVRAAETVIPAPATPIKADDLTIIEGIGPKIASVLQAAGIITFTQLAEADTAHLDNILINAGLRLADPGTWPEQARLAAEGKWEELKVLTDNLKGGRRVS